MKKTLLNIGCGNKKIPGLLNIDKPRKNEKADSVSILITAYKHAYFREALESALDQTHANLEIIICDDSPGDKIGEIVSEYASADQRIKYVKNRRNLGGRKNYIQCFGLAGGKYIKFLNDDDKLHPTCVERMANCLQKYPDVTLVTSHRQLINSKGDFLPDQGFNRRPVKSDSIINGVSLVNVMLKQAVNFIGEPTTVMFRKQDLEGTKPNIFSLGGRPALANGDVTIWINLLSRGDAVYLVDTLSYFRVHEGQKQREPGFAEIGRHAWEQAGFDAKRLGFLGAHGPHQLIIQPMEEGNKEMHNFNTEAPGGDNNSVTYSKVSIIIPLFNNLEYTKKCIEAIRGKTPNGLYELIIVDNGSTDGTEDFLKSFMGNIKIISNEKNLGFAKACNQGARASSSDYILFLNNDVEAQSGWLEPLLKALDNDSSVAAVSSKLLFPDGTIQHAGVLIVDHRKHQDPLLALNACYQEPSDLPEANEPRTYQALTAACLLVRRNAFDQVGGFDEGFWNGYEDTDLCFKLRMEGYKLVYQPESVLIHHEEKSGFERFSKMLENIARLHGKWLGKIKPDIILEDDNIVRQTGAMHIQPYIPPELPEKVTRQALPERREKLVSIVILTFNQLKYTRECIESIRRHTTETHEIIFVDNGSMDGTVKWLRRLVRENPNYKLIENGRNLGFAKGCNQGITESTGEYILLLNNDVVVTEGWLSGLIECISSAPDTGIIGPMTNNISGPQKVIDADYRTMGRLPDYARSFREKNRHRRIPFRRIVGFCMLFRHRLADSIGLLDESFGTGNFEDDDFCLRAAIEGFRNLIAGDVFIHHYGSRSFTGNRIDYGSAMHGNRKVFSDKWSGIDSRSLIGMNLLTASSLENADELCQKGRIEEAVKTLINCISNAPDDNRIYYGLTGLFIGDKQFKNAYETLTTMPENHKEEIRWLELAGYCKEGMELYDEANEYASRALSLNPDSASALNLKGILAYRKGNRAEAESFFKMAIKADPGFGEPYTNLGVLRWSEDKREEALNLLERGCILSPTIMDIVTTYHSAVAALGEFGRAEKIFKETKALYTSNMRIAFLLTDVLIRQGKNAQALEEIEESIIKFGIDDGLLAAAMEVREKTGPLKIEKNSGTKGAISLSMIVKNEEEHIARCLMSLKPFVDEMILVDTGSTDRTKDIARVFGAKVYDFEWTDNFSEARNYSLSKAGGGWILVLDADEVISPADHAALARIVKKNPARPAAYILVTRNYTNQVGSQGWTANDGRYAGEEAGVGWFPSSKARLFINDRRIKFENHVHEFVEASVQRAGIPVKPCDIPVHHYGRLDTDKIAAKGEAYYKLGMKKLLEKGDDAKALHELAVQAGELGKFEEAVELWQSVLRLESIPTSPA